jgi:light-regulated signal transduction histidine kinase (bacteriophytochrome)
MSIIIQGQDGPWGVLETHSSKRKIFSKNDINFLHSAANLLASAIANKKAKEQLIEKSKEIENINKELRDFVYTVSHDLKEPLFSINGYITRLYETYQDTYDEKGRRFSNRIKANIEIMSNRIQEILEVVRIGMITYDFKENPSESIIKNVLATLEDKIENNKINTLINSNLPTILCDEKRMRDVFYNLVINAIKFMGDDKQREITIGCEENGDNYKFMVEDTGIGIQKEYQENVFRIFSRLKKIETEGTGVGLVIVKKIIELHKGKIWIESPIARGKGTRFCFTIPKPRQ